MDAGLIMADSIRIKLPDGSEKEVPRGTTALDIARGISPRLADAALVARIAPISSNGHGGNGQLSASPDAKSDAKKSGSNIEDSPTDAQLVDLTRPLERDSEVRI